MRLFYLLWATALGTQIFKPISDTKNYHFHELPSGMKVFTVENTSAGDHCSGFLRLPVPHWNWPEGPPLAANLLAEVFLKWIESHPDMQYCLGESTGGYRSNCGVTNEGNWIDFKLEMHCLEFSEALNRLGRFIVGLRIDRDKLMKMLDREYVWTPEALFSPANSSSQVILSAVSDKTSSSLPPPETLVDALIDFIEHRFSPKNLILALEVPNAADIANSTQTAFGTLSAPLVQPGLSAYPAYPEYTAQPARPTLPASPTHSARPSIPVRPPPSARSSLHPTSSSYPASRPGRPARLLGPIPSLLSNLPIRTTPRASRVLLTHPIPLAPEIHANSTVPVSLHAHPQNSPLNLSLQKIIRTQSTFSFPHIQLSILLPASFEHLNSRPLDFLAHLIENPRKGSFLHKLRHRGWGNNLQVYRAPLMDAYVHLVVTLDLTPRGWERVEAVAALFFEYVRFLSLHMEEATFEDFKALRQLTFLKLDDEPQHNVLAHIVDNAPMQPPAKVLVGPYEPGPYNACEIKAVFEAVAPKNAVMLITVKQIEESAVFDPVSGRRYVLEELVVAGRGHPGELRLPAPAPFRLSVEELTARWRPRVAAEVGRFPEARDVTPAAYAPVGRLWVSRDEVSGEPAFIAELHLILDAAQLEDAAHRAAFDLAVELLQAAAPELAYSLGMVKAQCRFAPSHAGLRLIINGYSPGMDATVRAAVQFTLAFFTQTPEADAFEEQKANAREAAALWRSGGLAAYQKALWEQVAFAGSPTREEVELATQALTYGQFQQYFAGCLDRLKVELLVVGDVGPAEAVGLFTGQVEALGARLSPDVQPLGREVSLGSDGTLLLQSPAPSSPRPLLVVYQSFGASAERAAFAEVAQTLMAEHAREGELNGLPQLSFTLHEEQKQVTLAIECGSKDLEEVADFLDRFTEHVNQLDAAAFDATRQRVRNAYLHPLEAIPAQYRYLSRLMRRGQGVGFAQRIQHIDSLGLDEFRQLWSQLASGDGEHLVVLVLPPTDFEKAKEELQKESDGPAYFSLRDFRKARLDAKRGSSLRKATASGLLSDGDLPIKLPS